MGPGAIAMGTNIWGGGGGEFLPMGIATGIVWTPGRLCATFDMLLVFVDALFTPMLTLVFPALTFVLTFDMTVCLIYGRFFLRHAFV